MFLIVGLGNPGDEYARTRHNAGFILLDEMLQGESWSTNSNNVLEYCREKILGYDVEFIKPLTFMNNSGGAVKKVLDKHPDLNPENIIVVHDEIDLPVGEYKVSFDSGSAGHNGVESITNTLGTKEYHRIRIGVSPVDDEGNTRRPTQGEQGDFVLKKLSTTDYEKIISLAEKVKKEIEKIIEAKK